MGLELKKLGMRQQAETVTTTTTTPMRDVRYLEGKRTIWKWEGREGFEQKISWNGRRDHSQVWRSIFPVFPYHLVAPFFFFFFVITSYCSFGLDAGSWSSIYLKLKSELSRGFDTVGSCFMHETPFVCHLVFIEYFDGSFGHC